MRNAVRAHTGELVLAMGGSGVPRAPEREAILGNDGLDEAMLDA